MEVVRFGISLQCDSQWPSVGIPDVVEPERSAGRRVVQGTHDCIPGFAAGVAAEQHDLVEHRAAAVNFLPKCGILAVIHVIRGRVPDNLAMVTMRSLRIIAMRQVRGWEKEVSRGSAIPPDDESLNE